MRDIKYATDEIESKGLNYTVVGDGEYVMAQSPKAGSSLMKYGNIILYTDAADENEINGIKMETTVVPNLYGLTAGEANRKLSGAGLNINITGAGGMDSGAAAIGQKPEAGKTVPIGTVVAVEFRHNSVSD